MLSDPVVIHTHLDYFLFHFHTQRDHFKLDWHRFNIKQRLMGKSTVSEEDFEETIAGNNS